MVFAGILLLVLGLLKIVPVFWMTREELQEIQEGEGRAMHFAMLLMVADCVAEMVVGIELLVTD